MNLRSVWLGVVLVLVGSVAAWGAPEERGPTPSQANVAYGAPAADRLDFWRANTTAPAPLVIYFHGWGSDKSEVAREGNLAELLAHGVSVASVNYRDRRTGGTFPEGLHDCARALQFLRTQAKAWNVDPARVAVGGTSFGGSASLWLAFHDDMADAQATDPVLRQSTRVTCAGSISGQFSLDPQRWVALFGQDVVDRLAAGYKDPHLWGFETTEEVLGPAGQKVRADCDIIGLITKDDPPVFLVARRPDALTSSAELVHHPKLSSMLYDRCREIGVPVVAYIPALKIRPGSEQPVTWVAFVLRELRVTETQ